MNANNILEWTQYIQNIIISIHSQYKTIEIFYLFVLSLLNPMYILHFLHISVQTSHIRLYNSHMWVATVLESAELSSHPSYQYW
jgi:hypothetical protein